jgi:integrase
MITPKAKLRKDGTTAWVIRYRLAGRDSATTSRTFDTPEAAIYFAKLIDQHGPIIAEKILHTSTEPVQSVALFSDYAKNYLETLSGIEQSTIKTYRAHFRNDLSFLGSLPISAIGPDDIAKWVNEMAARGSSGKTIKNKHGFISQVFTRAVRDQVIPANPCLGTRLPRSIVKDMVFLTHSEYSRFLTCFSPYWQPFVEFLFATGVRFGEAAALRIMDIDTAARTVSITRAVKKDGSIGPPKSKRSRRTLALPPEVIDSLTPLISGRKPTDYLFTNQHGGRVRNST